MSLITCPFCGYTRDDGKEFRLTIYIGDRRIILPEKTPYDTAKKMVKGFPQGYLMQETLDGETDRVIASIQVWPLRFKGKSHREIHS